MIEIYRDAAKQGFVIFISDDVNQKVDALKRLKKTIDEINKKIIEEATDGIRTRRGH